MKNRRRDKKIGSRRLYIDENGKYILYGGKKSPEELAELRKNRANVHIDRKKQRKKYSCRNKSKDY